MKKIKTSDITAGVAYPPSKKGLDFLQQSYQEVVANLAQAFIGNTPSTTVGYALYGCIKTFISGSNYSLTAGAIYFNGEVYQVDAISSISIVTAPILTITTTNDPVADPTIFSDGSSKNVHNIRKMVLSDGTLGTGTLNYVDLKFTSGQQEAWSTYTIVDAKVTAVGGGFSSQTSTLKYKKVGKTMSWYLSSSITTTGTVTNITFDLADVFTLSAFNKYQLAMESVALNTILILNCLASTSLVDIRKPSGSFSATSYVISADGSFEIV